MKTIQFATLCVSQGGRNAKSNKVVVARQQRQQLPTAFTKSEAFEWDAVLCGVCVPRSVIKYRNSWIRSSPLARFYQSDMHHTQPPLYPQRLCE